VRAVTDLLVSPTAIAVALDSNQNRVSGSVAATAREVSTWMPGRRQSDAMSRTDTLAWQVLRVDGVVFMAFPGERHCDRESRARCLRHA